MGNLVLNTSKESLLSKRLRSEYNNAEVVFIQQGEKYIIKDFLHKGISVEFMLYNSNDFVIHFGEFDFFDKNALQKYFRNTLRYNNIRFEVNSSRIYVYNSQTDDVCYNVFIYLMKEIENVMVKLRAVLSA